MVGRFQAERFSRQFTFALNATVSSEINVEGFETLALQMPTAFTGTSVGFQACDQSGGTYQTVYDASGNAVTATVGTSRCVSLDTIALALAPYQWLKVTADAQAAARTLGMLMKA